MAASAHVHPMLSRQNTLNNADKPVVEAHRVDAWSLYFIRHSSRSTKLMLSRAAAHTEHAPNTSNQLTRENRCRRGTQAPLS